jgi:hypothetical protein
MSLSVSPGHPVPVMPRIDRWARGLLIGILALGALSALGGGVYGASGAPGVPRELLRDTPFDDFVVPSVVLMVIVGGAMLAGAIALLARAPHARTIAIGAGVILLGWIAVQVAMIGYVSWMQPATLLAALVIVWIGWALPERR